MGSYAIVLLIALVLLGLGLIGVTTGHPRWQAAVVAGLFTLALAWFLATQGVLH